jgi:hypothetical protein
VRPDGIVDRLVAAVSAEATDRLDDRTARRVFTEPNA